MSHIQITQPYRIPTAQVRDAVDVLAAKLRDRFGAQTQWDGNVLSFDGSGVSGNITVTDTDVTVEADLGFIYGLMKGPIEAEIRRVLAEKLV